jgi:phage I-like protein
MLPSDIETTPRLMVLLGASDAAGDGLLRIPLAVTGKWVKGGMQFEITAADLESIKQNFQARENGEINVDYEHASEMPEVAQGGPVPSAGRIVKIEGPEYFDTMGRLALFGFYEPTDRARELIRRGEYRYISPAVNWAAKSKRTGTPQGTELTSIALTNRPFLEALGQIRLSDLDFMVTDSEGPRGRQMVMELKAAHRQFLALIDERHKQVGSYMRALSEVAREHPGLASQYRAAVLSDETPHDLLQQGAERFSDEKARPVTKEVVRLVDLRISEKKCDYATALAEVGREHRELVERYRQEILDR